MNYTDIVSSEMKTALQEISKRKADQLDYKPIRHTKEIISLTDSNYSNYNQLVNEAYSYSIDMLQRIIGRMLEASGIDTIYPRNSSVYGTVNYVLKHEIDIFDFILMSDGHKYGYRLRDVSSEEWDYIDLCVQHNGLEALYVIALEKSDPDSVDSRFLDFKVDNEYLKYCRLKDFFCQYFSEKVYDDIEDRLTEYSNQVKAIIAFTTIPVLSSIKYSDFKEHVKNSLFKIAQEFVFHEPSGKLIYQDPSISLSALDYSNIKKAFIEQHRYRLLIGNEDFAKSLLTAEWLYSSLKDKKNFDYTAIIVDYSKTIEQLINSIMMSLVGHNYYIISSISEDDLNEIGIISYPWKKHGWKNYRRIIRLTEENLKYTSKELGGLCLFYEINGASLLRCSEDGKKAIIDLLNSFRGIRNEYLHKKNLYDWEEVNAIRNHALLLCFLIVGDSNLDECFKNVGQKQREPFIVLCEQVRELFNFNHAFTLSFSDNSEDTEHALFYPPLNRAEYDEDGHEITKALYFIRESEIERFSPDILNGAQVDHSNMICITKDHYPEFISNVSIDGAIRKINVKEMMVNSDN